MPESLQDEGLVLDVCCPRWVYHITTPFIWSNLCWKKNRFIPLRQLKLLVGIDEMILSIVFIAGMWIRQQLHCSILWMVCLFLSLVLDVPAQVRSIAIGSRMIQTCLWRFDQTLADLALWIMEGRTNAWKFAGWEFCAGRVLPKISLSHHNTLYLKQPLLKATRFIPLRQLELPLSWNCLCVVWSWSFFSWFA